MGWGSAGGQHTPDTARGAEQAKERQESEEAMGGGCTGEELGSQWRESLKSGGLGGQETGALGPGHLLPGDHSSHPPSSAQARYRPGRSWGAGRDRRGVGQGWG